MKFTSAALVAFAALASAQTLADIPSCAKKCLDDSVTKNTKCSTTDVPCICQNFDKVQGDATPCVISACGADVAVGKVLPAAQALCKNAGSGSSAPASSAAATTSAPASSAPASSAATSSAPASSAPTETGSASATGSAPATTLVPTSPSTTNGTSPSTSTPVTAGAAGFAPVGGLAMLALGALAL